jgi:Fe-S oxidoreductase/nitrate reductase gamma subunit
MRSVIFAVILVSALVFFSYSSRRLIRFLSIGRKENRFDRIGARLKNVLIVAFGQTKLLREPLAGWMHFFIFWGFVILLSAILEAILEGFHPGLTLELLGPLFSPVAAAQEVIGALVVISVLVALIRWMLVPPRRFYGPEITGHVRLDAALILILILTIMVSMFGTNATRMVLAGKTHTARFVSSELAAVFSGGSAIRLWFEFFWWTHILAVLGFLNYLPYSKHLHVLTSIPNVYFASLEPRGALSRLDLEDENAEKFGVDDVQDLSWKQLLDGYTCTDCGRCTAVCPANLTGKLLSPRKIIMNIRERTLEKAPLVLGEVSEPDAAIVSKRLLDNYVTDEELWACTTCRACMEECPVMIEHVPAIVDMRRFLVLSESRFPAELTGAFKNLETNYNPWSFNHQGRADWAKGLDVTTMADIETEVEILYWVGCAGSYDKRYEGVTRAMVKLMKAAGIKFAILGTEEKCTGDPARRSGNEYLAQMLINENVETLNKYKFKKIVATCPHCFNTLKNEYPQFGGNYEVVHHTVFLNQLIESGRLKVAHKGKEKITFHDSCYIGRYNGIYDAPRNLLQTSGASLVEMPRSRDKGFCCGAGGARMFMEETVGKRVNIERTEEALRLDPNTIATACPFCMTMMTDGVKAKDVDDKVQVRDVAEVLADSLR